MHYDEHDGDETTSQRVLVTSFEGWSDAGTAASSAVSHLASALNISLIDQLDAERFVDFQFQRPRARINDQGERELDWPNTKLWGPIASPGASEPDPLSDDLEPGGALQRVLSLDGNPVEEIYVLTGVEPARYWREYVDELMTIVMTWEIDLVIIVGSMFSDTPHSRPVPVNVYSLQEDVRAKFDAKRSDYEGPVGIGAVFEDALRHSGVDVLTLFAQIPHYVHSMPSPKATLAILDTLEELINLVIPHGNLISDAQQWENQVSLLTQQDEEMQGYIERLEAERDTVESPEATGDALAYEFEKFLQTNKNSHASDRDPTSLSSGDDTDVESGTGSGGPDQTAAPDESDGSEDSDNTDEF